VQLLVNKQYIDSIRHSATITVINAKQVLINAKLQTGKRGQTTQLTGEKSITESKFCIGL